MKTLFYIAIAGILSSIVPAAFAQDRVALLLVNSAYPGKPDAPRKSTQKPQLVRLDGVATDGSLMSDALKSTGFAVDLRENLTTVQMKTAVQEFARKNAGKREVLFYFSGHGLNLDGENFLAGVDTELDTTEAEQDARTRFSGEELEKEIAQLPSRVIARPVGGALPLQLVLANLDAMTPASAAPEVARRHVRIVLIDACRDAFPRGEPGILRSKGISAVIKNPGLAAQAVKPGMFIGFAALNGKVSFASKSGPSLFTAALVERLLKPGRMVDVFKDARAGVEQALQKLREADPALEDAEQIPSYTDELRPDADFSFIPAVNPDDELRKIREEAARLAAEKDRLATEKAQIEVQRRNSAAELERIKSERLIVEAQRKALDSQKESVAETNQPVNQQPEADSPKKTDEPKSKPSVVGITKSPNTPKPSARRPTQEKPRAREETPFEKALRESQNQ